MDGKTYNINGWYVVAHPLFIRQLEELTKEVEKLKAESSDGYKNKKATKRLAAIWHLIMNVITVDPANSTFRQGDTLGAEYKHWFRAKFYQQYRLFFRYDSGSRIIILAWVNDVQSLRAYGAKTDAYKVFNNMLESGHPPDDWEQLLAECGDQGIFSQLMMQSKDI